MDASDEGTCTKNSAEYQTKNRVEFDKRCRKTSVQIFAELARELGIDNTPRHK
jgi:hypothetical protein